MKRRVMRILLEQREIRVCEPLNSWGKLFVKAPVFWIGAVSHRSVQRPSLRSRKASSPRASRRPAATSFSNCRSQASASKSANQLRNAESSARESRVTADSISLTELMPQGYRIRRKWQVGRSASKGLMRLSCCQPALGLRLHLRVSFRCCRFQARHLRLPVAKERFPLVAPLHDIILRRPAVAIRRGHHRRPGLHLLAALARGQRRPAARS